VSMTSEFREFAMKGSVMDLAIGVVIGGAFQKIVDSMVNDIIMPVVGLLTGGIDFTNRFVTVGGSAAYATLEEAKKAGVPTVAYGLFLNQVLTFLIVAFTLFLVIKGVNRMRRNEPARS
jgi:large conductance mechanosensitive channel